MKLNLKKCLTILLSVLPCVGGCAPAVYGPATRPSEIVVAVEDRPYYTRGPYYIEYGRRYVWVGGHWGRRHGYRVWIPGHYVLGR